ncbi:uncharacterized protein LOC129003463 [Macrosteles quadrilineatus]|uniref:uncharacterized protein LOC129003463 n=1 Tax=Macrosteles quadrilineatus TaxID=74068 RepID=UPI0023E1E67E|nr:uncharacterized protein LOC129003463 [Macrosteles quadrilineatus]
MAGGQNEDICPVCKNAVLDDGKGVFCEFFCRKWYHSECVQISCEEYNYMSLLGKKSKWACSACEVRFEKVIEKAEDVEEIKSSIVNLLKIVNKVVSDNACINNKLDLILDSHTKPVDPNVNIGLEANISSQLVLPESFNKEEDLAVQVTDFPLTSQECINIDLNNTKLSDRPTVKAKSYAQATQGAGDRATAKSGNQEWKSKVAKQSRPSNRKQSIIIGSKLNDSSNSQSKVRAVERKSWVFVSRLASDTKPDEITSYLQDSNIAGYRFFNHLPVAIRDLPISRFKAVVKDWLIENPFYDLSEFYKVGLPVLL